MKKITASTKLQEKDLPSHLKRTFHELNKLYGDNTVQLLGSNPGLVDVPGQIPTGSLALDFAIGVVSRDSDGGYRHGVPLGRTIEIYGKESSGKTSLCNHIIAEAQKKGKLCAFIDMEQSWDRRYAKEVGVLVDNLIMTQPNSGEEALNICEHLVKTQEFGVIVVDSVASLVPMKENDGAMGDHAMGGQARLMSQAMRKLTPLIKQSETCLIFTNQVREKIGVFFGNPEVTTGGNALKFYATLRISVSSSGSIKDTSGVQVGHMVKAKVVKNKIAPPFRTANFNMIYGKGVDTVGELVQLAVDFGIIEQAGSYFYYGKEKIGQGMSRVRDFFDDEENLKMREDIYHKVMDFYLKDDEGLEMQAEKKVSKKDIYKDKKGVE